MNETREQAPPGPPARIEASELRIGPSPTGVGYRLESSQWLPRPRAEVFPFFSDAFNLQALTPDYLHFEILTPQPIEMATGLLIDYRLRLRGIPIRWQSRIAIWEPPFRFVDEQMRGPYRRWYHEHTFEEVDGGTLCRDIVDYEVHGGPLIERLFVRPDLRGIFTYRRARLAERFPAAGDTP